MSKIGIRAHWEDLCMDPKRQSVVARAQHAIRRHKTFFAQHMACHVVAVAASL